MKITDVTSLVTLILTISLASERLVTLIKTAIPWLSNTPNPTSTENPNSEILRKVIVLIISIICSVFTASIINGWPPHGTISVIGVQAIPILIVGLLASAGSSFWSNILGYVKAVKEIKVQKSLQEKHHTKSLFESKAN